MTWRQGKIYFIRRENQTSKRKMSKFKALEKIKASHKEGLIFEIYKEILYVNF